jgi:hypothetical protein
MSGEPRFVRVSERGKWHHVEQVVETTGALRTRCGRVFPAVRIGGWEAASRVRLVARCEKCQSVRR